MPKHCVFKFRIKSVFKMEESSEDETSPAWRELWIGLEIKSVDDTFVADFVIELAGLMFATISIHNPLHKAHHYRDFLNGDRYSLWFVDGNNNRISFEWKDEDMIKCEVRTKEGTGKGSVILNLPAKLMKEPLENLAAEFE